MTDGQVIILVIILINAGLILYGMVQGQVEAKKIKKHKRIMTIRRKWLISKCNCEVE